MGDSTCVKFANGKAEKLSTDHKTTIKAEYDRIIKSGGKVINNRVDGRLNLTRAIGDLCFKSTKNLIFYEQSVTSYPDTNVLDCISNNDFLVLGCDGVWDCVDLQKFCEDIDREMRENKERKLSEIISEIFDKIISPIGGGSVGTDNMSCIIVQLKKKKYD